MSQDKKPLFLDGRIGSAVLPERLFRIEEAAQILSMSPKTLYSYSARGLISKIVIGGRIKFSAQDLADFINKHRIAPVDPA